MRSLSLLPAPSPHGPVERYAFDSIDSTNAFAARWMRLSGAASEAAILSRAQTAGRGQHGRHWSTEGGNDLAWSYARRMGEPVRVETEELVALNMAWSVAVLETVRAVLPAEAELGLKWPNDVFGRRPGGGWGKLGGLLLEAHWRGDGCIGAVLGVGLNLASERRGFATPATSVRELGGDASAAGLARDLEGAVRAAWNGEKGPAAYRERLLFCGAERWFELGGERRRGAFMGALPDGRGRFRWFEGVADHAQGEVTWLWDQG